MKINELIVQLEKVKAEHGDLDVGLWGDDMEDVGEFAGVATAVDETDKAVSITLCGPETLLAFS